MEVSKRSLDWLAVDVGYHSLCNRINGEHQEERMSVYFSRIQSTVEQNPRNRHYRYASRVYRPFSISLQSTRIVDHLTKKQSSGIRKLLRSNLHVLDSIDSPSMAFHWSQRRLRNRRPILPMLELRVDHHEANTSQSTALFRLFSRWSVSLTRSSNAHIPTGNSPSPSQTSM